MYSVNEVAKMSSVTKRTLRYYHKIGLLEPVVQENGYRALTLTDMYVADERFASYYNEKTKKNSVELLAEIIRESA